MKKFILAIILIVIWPFTAWGAGAFISYPKFQAFDDNAVYLSGGWVATYECGSATPKATYSDRAMTSANANPVELDTRGECNIFTTGCIKIRVYNSDMVLVIEEDNFGGVGESFIQDADGDTLVNVEESTDEDIIRFDIGGTEQVIVQDGSIAPTTTDDIDVGTNALRMKKTHTNQISGHSFPGFFMRPNFTYVESLDYDGGTLDFTVGETVTGAGGGTGVIVAISTVSTTVSGTVYLDTRNAVAYVNDEVITSAAGAAVANQISAKNSIVISSFIYYHCGTIEQLLYSDSNLAYEFVSLGTSDWSYLYFDDSAIVTAATNLISISELIDNIGEPLYSAAKHGRYHQTTLTDDMCFFAVLTDGSDDILEFFHDGGDLLYLAAEIQERAAAILQATWTDVDCATSMPSFSQKAILRVGLEAKSVTTVSVHWRVNGQASTVGHLLTAIERIGTDQFIYAGGLTVMTDDDQIFEVKTNGVAGSDEVQLSVNGWFFPNGM